MMIPLLLMSFATWAIVFERWLRLRKVKKHLKSFSLEAANLLLRGDFDSLERLCRLNEKLPQAQLVQFARERKNSKDSRIQKTWKEAIERKRQAINLEMRSHLWLLGTIATSAPFVGLFGTVVGILQSFRDMAEKGAGGFAVVASGISEALVATAAGIIVAIVALLAYNFFQTQVSQLVIQLRWFVDEILDILSTEPGDHGV